MIDCTDLFESVGWNVKYLLSLKTKLIIMNDFGVQRQIIFKISEETNRRCDFIPLNFIKYVPAAYVLSLHIFYVSNECFVIIVSFQ